MPPPPKFLVTAGNTPERIDAVRDWGNIFTGNTGLSIAKALANIGPVDFLTSNREHLSELSSNQPTPHPIRATPFTTHEELRGALAAVITRETYTAVFMTAAVADYKPVAVYEVINRTPTESGELWQVHNVQAGKVRSTYPQIAVFGQPTEKLIDLFRTEWNYRGLLVKFKLEVGISKEDLIRIGQSSRQSSQADYLVANTLDMVEGPNAGAYLLSNAGNEWVPRAELPTLLSNLVRTVLPNPSS
jgi:phosphopantothenoylcysteine synthetase/decarboxylase